METVVVWIHAVIFAAVIIYCIGYVFYAAYCWLLDKEAKKFEEDAALTGMILAITWEIWAVVGLGFGFMYGLRFLVREARSFYERRKTS